MAFSSVSCSGGDTSKTELKTVYVRTDADRGSMQAHFFNSAENKVKEVEMELDTKEKDYSIYKVSESTQNFDAVSFTRDNADETIQLSFSDYVSGWYLSSYGVVPFVYGEELDTSNIGKVKYETVKLEYSEKREKKIFIWVPDDYNAEDKNTKYSVIYMTDGHNLFDRSATAYGSWAVAESVMSMTSINENAKAIIVGIDNGDGYRDHDLTPDIGEVIVDDEAYENGGGEEFSDFLCEKVVPYIEKNYNVYTDREHTSICGSSSGGIESFYIGMEHPDKFGTIGALSPAFLLFGDETWQEYLKSKIFDEYPEIYIYSGSATGDQLEQAICAQAEVMKDNLATIDYPKEKIHEQYLTSAAHNESYWRAIFPQFLYYAFPKTDPQ